MVELILSMTSVLSLRTSALERATLGIPSVIVPVAQNQLESCQQFIDEKAVIGKLNWPIKEELVPAITSLLSDWDEHHRASYELCDGLGSKRLLGVSTMCVDSPTDRLGIKFRLCGWADIDIVFEVQRCSHYPKVCVKSKYSI